MAKAYEELEIRDDFMYGKATEDLEVARRLMEMATGREIESLHFAENQKTIIATMEGKDVRLDSYVEDNENVIYDSEMQNRSKEDKIIDPQLPKRSRYYQGMIDINVLEGGARYQTLNRSYIVFFCTFDPFGKGLKRYTFENICLEDSELKLGDMATKIFFNTKGKKEGKMPISKSQEAFLKYVETGEVTDEITQLVDNKVKEVRENKKWRTQYMKTLTHDQDVYNSGVAEGITQGISHGIHSATKEFYERCIADGMDEKKAAELSGWNNTCRECKD